MNENTKGKRGYFGIIISKEILEDKDLSITEKFIYGYIASFTDCCFMPNEEIAERLGISESTVAHTLPKLVEKGFIFIEKINNDNTKRRVYAILDNPKKLAYLAKKGMFKPVENPVEKCDAVKQNSPGVMQNMQKLMQNLHNTKTGVRSAKFAEIDIEEKRRIENEQKPNLSKGAGGLALKEPATAPTNNSSLLTCNRKNYKSEEDFEKAFYERNTVKI